VKAFVVILVILLQSEEFRKKFKRMAPKERIVG
jgi:hypothetical protein